MKAKEHPEWPSSWACIGGSAPSAAEVSQYGKLVGARLSSNAGIHFRVECTGKTCDGYFLPKDRVAQLQALCDRFAACLNASMREVENIEL